MSLIKWEPWGDMGKLFDEFSSASLGRSGWDLSVDMYEDGGNVVAKMQIPGIDPAKLNVSVEDDYLCISGSREEEKEEKNKQYYRKEIRKGSFDRMIALPSTVDKDKVDAQYERGMLTVTMPRKEKRESSGKIEVKVKS
jgi:HSP20 family protein